MRYNRKAFGPQRRSSSHEASMLLSIVGGLRIGTSPRPIMAARLIVPREVLVSAGMTA